MALYLLVLAVYFARRDLGDSFNTHKSLLVIAHPDDEVMFFGPTLNYYRRRNGDLHVLCLSTGVCSTC